MDRSSSAWPAPPARSRSIWASAEITPRNCKRFASAGLDAEILVISGGVSAGVLDLVPAVLESLGVERVFHKVNLKPGKPLWFGVKEVGQASSLPHKTLVFGLPGNPVSSLVCFELFVRPAIARMLGCEDGGLQRIVARLGRDFHQRGDRVTMFPASLRADDHGITATPLDWRGSGDLRHPHRSAGADSLPLRRATVCRRRGGGRAEVLVIAPESERRAGSVTRPELEPTTDSGAYASGSPIHGKVAELPGIPARSIRNLPNSATLQPPVQRNLPIASPANTLASAITMRAARGREQFFT